MRTYKNSVIEWIGEIPEGWEISTFKYLFDTNKGLTITKENLVEVGIPVINYGQIHSTFKTKVVSTDNNLPKVSEKFLIYQKSLVKQGDFIFADTSEDLEGAGNFSTRLDSDSLLFAGYHTIVSRAKYLDKFNYNYFKNLFDSDFFRNQIRIKVSGVKVFSITQSILKNCIVLVPPLQEQAAIADFLDKKNAEIDAIIVKLTQQIQTLKDYRHSLITQTVTKGLDKTVAYKDSGIEWLGKIPEGWGKSDVKYLFEIISGATPESSNSEYWDGPINWITPADMNPTGPIKNGEKTITMLGYQSCGTTMIPENSIIISNRAPIGKVNYNQTELCTSQGCKGLINIKKNNLLYFYYFFIAFTNQLKLLGRGTTFLELSTKDLGNFSLIVPPLQEQTAIADYLDDKTTKIDCIIDKKEQQLELIKEHRKSLIYEFVTGKKRVKEYQEDGN